MSRGRAPTARRIPISRVRSVTETSMMFMMPTPPTTSDTLATEPNSSVITVVMIRNTLTTSEVLWTVKSSGRCRADAVPLTHQRLDFVFSSGIAFGRAGQHVDDVHVVERPAVMRLLMVVQGASTTLSWSWPKRFAPLASRTPITVNGMFLMRIVEPTQSAVWNRLSATVSPMTQTLAAAWMSRSVKKSPLANLPIAHRRVERVDADDFVGRPILISGDTCAAGIHHGRGRQHGGALGHHGVGIGGDQGDDASGALLDAAPVRLPGRTMITLVPRLWNCSCTIRPADWLIETSRMTAATPMTIPSTVRPARSLFFAKARKATRKIIKRFMIVPLPERVGGDHYSPAAIWRPTTSSCPSVRSPETSSVQLLVAQAGGQSSTAASRSPSATQTCRRLRFRAPGAARSCSVQPQWRLPRPVGPARRASAFEYRPVGLADLLGLRIESQGRVGNVQHASVLLDLEGQVGRHPGQQLELRYLTDSTTTV